MKKKYIMALDEGTTGCRCIIFDKNSKIISAVGSEFNQYFPKPGWVEQNPEEIFDKQLAVAKEALSRENIDCDEIAAIGITNQRETTVVWNKNTGKPIAPAIVWQCRRTADYCNTLKEQGYTDCIREKTGLQIDAYFSASKIRWILDNTPGAKEEAAEGNLLFGTIDCWLLWKLTEGRIHATDYSNAARTMLFNINTLKWDEDLLKLFDIPKSMLPEVRPNSQIYDETTLLGKAIPVAGMAGDQQSALFGQCCFEANMAKNTYGTGCFMLMNTGEKPVYSGHGLVTTIGWMLNNKVTYALEGSVFMAGASVQWLRDQLGIIEKSSETEAMALSVPDNGGVTVVPAFTGLGAPYWKQEAKAIITGLTRGSNKNHIARATLEGIAFQVYDVFDAMIKDTGNNISALKVDGGAAANKFLMQFQADILNTNLVRPDNLETTALGAAYLAGLAVGYWDSKEEIITCLNNETVFTPLLSEGQRRELLAQWQHALKQVTA